MSQFHVIVIHLRDDQPRLLSPKEALLHARAEHYRTKYRAIISVVAVQVFLTALMAGLGVPAGSITIGILGGALAIAAASCLAAWGTRKDILE